MIPPALVAAGDRRWTPTAPEPADPGHLLPAEAWAAVAAGAQAPPASHGRALPDRTVTAYAHGGVMAGGPRLGVIHSAETPLTAGYAYSIAANWFATAAAGTSATVMIDPAETIRLLPDNVVAYHVGPAGNGFTVGVEQAGRTAMARTDWLTAPGRAQLARVAAYMRECRERLGIPLRWATDAQIRAAAVAGSAPQGWCLHDDVRRVLGGTTHTDPGASRYPKDELMAAAIAGGDDMPLTDADAALVARHVMAYALGLRGPGDVMGATTTVEMVLARVGGGQLADDAATAVLRRPIDRAADGAKPGSLGKTSLGAVTAYSDAHITTTRALISSAAKLDPAAVAAALQAPLAAAVKAALAGVDGTDPAATEAATERALRRVLGSLDGAA